MNALERLETVREQKQSRMDEINKLVADDGRTKTDAEREEYRGLVDDIKAIDEDIVDLKDADTLAKRATPVNGNGTKEATGSRATNVVVRQAPKPEPGILTARLAMCLTKAEGNPLVAHALMKQHYPDHPALSGLKMAGEQGEKYGNFISKLAEVRTKAAVDGGTTAAGSWAAALLAHNNAVADFQEYLAPRTISGQMGMLGSGRGFRNIPFNVPIKGQSAGSTGGWVGEGQPVPVSKGVYFDADHSFNKIGALSVISEELIRFSDPAAEALVRDDIAKAVIRVKDGSLVDTTAVSASRPAGLLNGVSGSASSGPDHAAIKEDIKTLWAAALAANIPIESAVYWTTPAIALSLSLMHGELSDAPLFPNIGLRGGEFIGIPVIVSNYVPSGNFILVFGQEVYFSEDSTIALDASRDATIEMEGPTPENAISDLDGSTPAPVPIGSGHAFVNMFQNYSVALRAIQAVNWSKRRATAVNRLTSVEWGAEGS